VDLVFVRKTLVGVWWVWGRDWSGNP